ncbi:hypothetical protein BC332_34096 [Capsicum chinense]|nr:hypothetical protein BC332_34096 [Capsicum chinense]
MIRGTRKLFALTERRQGEKLKVLIGSDTRAIRCLMLKVLLNFLNQHSNLSNTGLGETFGRVTIEAMAFGLPEFASDLVKNSDEATSKSEDENTETNNTGLVSKSPSCVEEKSLAESNVPKVTVARGKKKKTYIRRQMLLVRLLIFIWRIKSQMIGRMLNASTPELEAAPGHGKKVDGEEGEGATTKKYSRDFLLKFAEQCIDIHEGFNVAPDIADILIIASYSVSREPGPSPGRGIDRPSSGHRESRGSGIGDGDKWSKTSGPVMPGRNFQPDLAFGGNAMGYRPGPGGNYGVLRNLRAPMPIQYTGGQFVGGILAGPMQSMEEP